MAPKKKKTDQEPCKAARFGRSKNTLKMGIVGLPNVGKSSLFNVLCDMEADAANYPFCTIDPTESRCIVPDSRFDHLQSIYKPQATVPSYLSVTDIAGLVKGAAEGAGLGNEFLSNIASVDGIFHVVRAFPDSKVLHVETDVNPVRDLEIIMGELCRKDLTTIKKAEDLVLNQNKNKKLVLPENYQTCLDAIKALLEENKPLLVGDWSTGDIDHINEFYPNLFTTKPIVYLVNCSMAQFRTGEIEELDSIKEWVAEHGGGSVIPFSVKFEQGYLKCDEEKKADILAKTGKKSVIPEIIRSGYDELQLINFFTCGPKEVRSWTVLKGATAPQAAAVIHTDFQKNFIKAEVVSFDDFKEFSTKASMDQVRAAGKYRQEGKNYIVKDGDILNIMHNAK